MSRLFIMIHTMAMTVLMGAGVTAVLAMNMPGWKPLVVAALAGFVISLPVAWVIAKKIEAVKV